MLDVVERSEDEKRFTLLNLSHEFMELSGLSTAISDESDLDEVLFPREIVLAHLCAVPGTGDIFDTDKISGAVVIVGRSTGEMKRLLA